VQLPLSAPAILGVLAFWGGALVAESRYPTEFDWRYMTLSTLLSPSGNPVGHRWAAAGIGLSGCCWLCWAVLLGRRRDHAGADYPVRGTWALGWGGLCTACSGLLPVRIPGLPKGHELLTILAFAGLCIGLVRLTTQVAGRAVQRRASHTVRRSRLWAASVAGVVVLPIILTGLAQAYVFFARPELHWVGLDWRAHHVPVYLSFAFWEWVTCAVLSVHVAALALAASADGVAGS
jgi:hypothetical protein